MIKLLMIDDDVEVLEINRKFFEKKDFEVNICSDSNVAIKSVIDFKPDCILLDVMMPDID